MLTIADRRAVSGRAAADPEFRQLLRDDPAAAVAALLGDAATGAIELIEESPVRWAFVIPDRIDGELPAPTDPRSAIENDVYRVLRDEPDTMELATRDPRAFLHDRFGIAVRGVDLRRESPGRVVLVIPYAALGEELDDALLDLVAGGGSDPAKGA